jgi:uncharacterized membrane protein
LAEGSKFEFNEASILEVYRNQGENKSSLAIKVLSIFGGFLATLAFLACLAIMGLYDSPTGLFIFGLGCIIAAIWINKAFDKLIIDTFSISIYVSGFLLFAFGLSEMSIDNTIVAALVAIIAFISLIITQNFILSFISVITISSCLLIMILSNDAYSLIHVYIAVFTVLLAYLFLKEATIISQNKKLSKLYNPIRIGLVISLIMGLITVGKRGLIPLPHNDIWISSVVILLVLLYVIHLIIKMNQIEAVKRKVLMYVLSSLLLLSTLFAPAISGAITIILLSFLVNYKTGFYIGIISLIYFISQYYYDLNFTLLTKSILLMSSGVVFLLLYLFTSKTTSRS